MLVNALSCHDILGGGRFLKTALCVHDDGGLVVVKVAAPSKGITCTMNARIRLPGLATL